MLLLLEVQQHSNAVEDPVAKMSMDGWSVLWQYLLRVVLTKKQVADQTLEIAWFVFGARDMPIFQ